MNQGSNDHDPNQANANAIIRIAALFSDWMWMRPAGHTTTITTITAAKIDATLRESVHRALFIGQTALGLRPCVSTAVQRVAAQSQCLSAKSRYLRVLSL